MVALRDISAIRIDLLMIFYDPSQMCYVVRLFVIRRHMYIITQVLLQLLLLTPFIGQSLVAWRW